MIAQHGHHTIFQQQNRCGEMAVVLGRPRRLADGDRVDPGGGPRRAAADLGHRVSSDPRSPAHG